MNENEKEKIILDPPALEAAQGSYALAKRRGGGYIVRLSAALLSLISLAFHVMAIVHAAELICENGGEFFFSSVMPEYEISEPMLPPRPEGELIEKEEDEDEDVLFSSRDLSSKAPYGFSLSNETSYTPDLLSIAALPSPAMSYGDITRAYGKGEPCVLIYHTHATEGFKDCSSSSFRSSDSEKNMIAIGDVICRVLERAGIGTVHLTERFDEADFNSAYDKSHEKVLATLEKYPSIQYVFDVHRDCIGNAEEGFVSADTTALGYGAAQLMFVCGTDEGGSGHASWRDNLTVALHLQRALNRDYPTLMRPLNLRRASFYQSTRPAALLLECGTCANTLTEAKRGAVLFASALADYIKAGNCGLDEGELIRSLCP